MEKSKILILKDDSNNFESYVSTFFKDCGVDTMNPYNKLYLQAPLLWMITKKLNLNFFTKFFLSDWKNYISKYNVVVIFDNCVSKPLLKFVNCVLGKHSTRTWLWNVELQNIEWIKRYSEAYCFDKVYSAKHEIRYLPQFYFTDFPNNCSKVEKKKVFFIGQDKGRLPILKEIATYLKSIHVEYSIVIRCNENVKDELLTYINKNVTYETVIDLIKQSSTIIEINKEGQNGLTLRALEALYYKKKLITNNTEITKEFLYSKDNVFVLGVDPLSELKSFIESDYHTLQDSVYQYYSFSNWFNHISE